MLGDITCDSDGKLDRFVDRRDVKKTLPLHAASGAPYYLACSWSGHIRRSSATCTTCSATRTRCTSASIRMERHGSTRLIKGDTVKEVLDYVEFDAETLLRKLRTDVETAVREGRVDYEGAGRLLRFYEDGLHGYTYLEG